MSSWEANLTVATFGVGAVYLGSKWSITCFLTNPENGEVQFAPGGAPGNPYTEHSRLKILQCTMLIALYALYRICTEEVAVTLLQGHIWLMALTDTANFLYPFLAFLFITTFRFTHYVAFSFGNLVGGQIIFFLPWDVADVASYITGALLAAAYLRSGYWLVQDVIVLGSCSNLIETLHVGNVWSALAPALLIALANDLWGMSQDYSMALPICFLYPLPQGGFLSLGMAEVILPGLFLSLIHRYDALHSSNHFYCGLLAYAVFLLLFLLKLVPLSSVILACVLVPLGVAFWKGNLNALMNYSEMSFPAQ